MKNRLSLEEQEKIERRYHDHPLLKACKCTFFEYQERMSSMMFSPIEVFVEAVEIIDELLSPEIEWQDYISSLWQNLVIKYKLWQHQLSYSEDEIQTAVSSVIYTVYVTILESDDYDFSKAISAALYKEIERHNSKVIEQEDSVIVNICRHAEKLKEWVSEYEESDHYLSEEIESLITKKKIVRLKKGNPEFVPSGRTFTKSALLTDIQIDIIGQRLSLANKLDATPDDFRKLFSGVDSHFTMKWLGHPGELRDLFKMLTNLRNGETRYVTPKRGYQLILRSHFLDKDGNQFEDLDAQKSIESFKPIINDCEFFIQHLIDKVTQIMKTILNNNEGPLEDSGYYVNPTSAKQEGLHIKNKLR